MMKLLSPVIFAFLLSAGGAFAEEAVPSAPAAAPAPAPSNGAGDKLQARSISWQEFQQRCSDPKAFPNDQTPILSAVINCTDTRKEYVSAAPADVPLRGARILSYDVSSEKFLVAANSAEMPVLAQTGSCLRFKEIEKVYSVQRQVSCADILNIKGDLASFCMASLDRGKWENPKSVATRDTGVMIDTCTNVEHQERTSKVDHGGKNGDRDHGGKGSDDDRNHGGKGGDDDRNHGGKGGDDDRNHGGKGGDDDRNHGGKGGDDDRNHGGKSG